MEKRYVIILCILSLSLTCFSQVILVFQDDTTQLNDTATMVVEINNDEPVSAFQFDIVIPQEFSFIEQSAVLSGREADHSLVVSPIAEDSIRFIAFSPTNSQFRGNSGEVVRFELLAGSVPGLFTLPALDCIVANSQGANILDSIILGEILVQQPQSNDAQPSSGFDIFPNPCSGHFILNIPGHHSGTEILLLSINGSLIRKWTINNLNDCQTFTIPGECQSGTYAILIKELDTGTAYYKNLIIIK